MRNTLKNISFVLGAALLSSCSSYYEDQELPLTEQEYNNYMDLKPTGSIREGVFHMQRVGNANTVLKEAPIQLKRPDLPPFDVAYISRNVESVLLELANAAGESVVLPQGIRNRTVTIVHSGANFQEMLDIVLAKIGYHYDYVNGVWYVTRFPTRTYNVEITQSSRSGSLIASSEFSPEQGENVSKATTSEELDTKYSDEVWDQIEATVTELIQVGNVEPSKASASGGVNLQGQFVDPNASEDDIFDGLEDAKKETTTTVTGTDHLQPEEKAQPWYKITRSAGLITVRAAPEAHRLLEEYLSQVQASALKQIEIEVRILALVKNHKTDRGTDWSGKFEIGDALGSIGFSATEAVNAATSNGSVLQVDDSNMNFILQMLSTKGTLHTITSPTILSRNNQMSRISLTRQLGYAETEIEQNTTSDGSVVIGSRTDTPKFKNSGTVLSVFPYIGQRKVQLRMRLSVASKSGDTAIQTRVGAEETITNLVPELSNNIVDQDMVLEYGRIYAVSRFIETSSDATRDYIPGISEIPGMREIMQRASTEKTDTEFIVLLRVSRS